MPPERQREYIGEDPDAEMLALFGRTIELGYAVSRGDVFAGSTNIAAPIFEMDGRPIGAVLISVPNDRAGPSEEARLGELVQRVASALSRGSAARRREPVVA
jgi:IclR family acetate operon transcriptional repressor